MLAKFSYEFDAVDSRGDFTPKNTNNRELANVLATFSYEIRLVNKDYSIQNVHFPSEWKHSIQLSNANRD